MIKPPRGSRAMIQRCVSLQLVAHSKLKRNPADTLPTTMPRVVHIISHFKRYRREGICSIEVIKFRKFLVFITAYNNGSTLARAMLSRSHQLQRKRFKADLIAICFRKFRPKFIAAKDSKNY